MTIKDEKGNGKDLLKDFKKIIVKNWKEKIMEKEKEKTFMKN